MVLQEILISCIELESKVDFSVHWQTFYVINMFNLELGLFTGWPACFSAEIFHGNSASNDFLLTEEQEELTQLFLKLRLD